MSPGVSGAERHSPTRAGLAPATASGRQLRRAQQRPVDVFSQWSPAPPTSGELESLFFDALTNALPLHFSTGPLLPARQRGLTHITNAHVLVLGARPGTSYCDLFGSWSEQQGYRSGPIVRKLDRLVPFLKARNISDLAQAQGYLAEAVLVRKKQLRPTSRSYRQHVHMVRVMEGTLQYMDRLLQWLKHEDAC